MNEYIDELLQRLFQGVPYSKKAMDARADMRKTLIDKYEGLLKTEKSDIAATGRLMCECGTLADAARYTGISEETIAEITEMPPTHSAKALRKDFRKGKALSILAAIFVNCAIQSGMVCVLLKMPLHIVSVALYLGLSAVSYALYRKVARRVSYGRLCLDSAAKEKYDIYADRYKKRHVNFVYALVAFIANFATVFENALVARLSAQELLGAVISQLYVLGAGIMLFVYSGLLARLLLGGADADSRARYKAYALRAYKSSALFVIGAAAAALLLKLIMYNPFPIIYVLTGVYILISLIYNYRKRVSVVISNIRINVPRITCFALAAIITLTLSYMRRDVYVLEPYIAGVAAAEHAENPITYDDPTGEYTITAGDGDFRILHLTDIHLGGSVFSSYKDYKALEACRKLINYAEPDFIIVTGDLVYPMGISSFSLNNEAPVRQFASFMRNINIPWAMTFGNHDTESMATGTKETINALYESLSYRSSGTLLYPYVQPNITGRNNQLIRVNNADGSLRQALFLVDSNDYTGSTLNDYDYIHDDQVSWYAGQVEKLSAEAGHTIPSMVFFHIPLQEYRYANELYEAGSDEVRYFFGEIGETMTDKVCCSKYPSKLFDTALELGSTKAMFCGHDHYNNISLEYKGIRLTYGMSIDYLAMPGIASETKQRGGELITVHGNSTFDISQIQLSDID